MKYSLFTVSVPEMTLEEAAKKMQEYGYDGVDWRVTDIPTDPEIIQTDTPDVFLPVLPACCDPYRLP